ncbi:hypothetical protein AYY21_11615 [Photobacterium aquimaris]|nr:hypothetical protein AYY21_11615 [Photobacterium aquimaris]
MGLQRNKSIKEVCSSLDLALQSQPKRRERRTLSSQPPGRQGFKDPAGEIKGFMLSLADQKQYPLAEILRIYWQR